MTRALRKSASYIDAVRWCCYWWAPYGFPYRIVSPVKGPVLYYVLVTAPEYKFIQKKKKKVSLRELKFLQPQDYVLVVRKAKCLLHLILPLIQGLKLDLNGFIPI